METTKYVRNPLYVDVVEVTVENFTEVMMWCQGDIANKNGEPLVREENVLVIDPPNQFIHVRVHNPKSIRQTQAFVGDFVLYTDRGYKVYTPGAFNASWTKVVEEEPVYPPIDRGPGVME